MGSGLCHHADAKIVDVDETRASGRSMMHGNVIDNTNVNDFDPEAFPHSDESKALILKALQGSFMFSDMVLEGLVNFFRPADIAQGTTLIEQGDTGDFLYIVESGMFTVHKRATNLDAANAESSERSGNAAPKTRRRSSIMRLTSHLSLGKVVAEVGPGTFFGELALLYGAPRSASVRCKEAAKVWSIDRKTFHFYRASSGKRRKSLAFDRLRNVPLLKDLSSEELADVAKATEEIAVQEGQVIIRKGDHDKDFYVILEGVVICTDDSITCSVKSLERRSSTKAISETASTSIQTTPVPLDKEKKASGHRLRPGNHFGEIAVLTGEPRSLNVVADSHARLLKFDEEAFQCVLGSLHDLLDKRANQRMCVGTKFVTSLPEELRDVALQDLNVRSFERGCVILSDYGALPPLTDEGDASYEAAKRERSPDIEELAESPMHYVVKSGTVVVQTRESTVESALKSGDDSAPTSRPATTHEERIMSFDFFSRKKQGDSFGNFFTPAAPPPPSESVGANSNNIPVSAISIDEVECVSINLDKLRNAASLLRRGTAAGDPLSTQPDSSIGDLQGTDDSKSSSEGTASEGGSDRPRNQTEAQVQQTLDIDWMQLRNVGRLGAGTFGIVLMMQDRRNGHTFAMKVLDKRRVRKMRQEKRLETETMLLESFSSPFISRLFAHTEDSAAHYLLLELVQGGELQRLIHPRDQAARKQQHDDVCLGKLAGIPHQPAKFYAAAISIPLNYIHQRHVAFRDLKPENVMLDSEGYPKLIDFGLAKPLDECGGTSYTLCGTPEYLAPEVILGIGHDQSVDWWALGILLYEMVAGASPFLQKGVSRKNQDHMAIFEDIVENRIKIPDGMEPGCRDLIRRLLETKPILRIGNGKGELGENQFKNHYWFKGNVNWRELAARRLQPPWKPPIGSSTDRTWFSTEKGEDR